MEQLRKSDIDIAMKIRRRGKHSSMDKIIKHLGEEVSELAIAYGREDWENFLEELGDCLFILHTITKMSTDKSLMDLIHEHSIKIQKRYATK